MRYLILGAGALGGFFGGMLASRLWLWGDSYRIPADLHISFDVTFADEVEIVGGKPVVQTLRGLATEVDRVVGSIRAAVNELLTNAS